MALATFNTRSVNDTFSFANLFPSSILRTAHENTQRRAEINPYLTIYLTYKVLVSRLE